MLARGHRLTNDKEIKALVRTGQTFFLSQMLIKYRFYGPDKKTKVAFVVSTKIDKRAVIRNRVARRLREAFRALLPDIKNGYLVLIIAKKNIDQIRNQNRQRKNRQSCHPYISQKTPFEL